MCNTAVGVLLYTGSETWLFDDGDWALQSQGAQPPGRGATALTRFGDGALMFGGQGAAGMMNDTWVWTAAEGWTELKPSARAPDEGSPVGRSMHSLATFDMGARDGELVVMFGGATTGEPRMTALGDTWVLAATHGNRWYQKAFNDTIIPGTTIEHAAAPPARWGHSMICHDAPAGPLKKGYCMMFGGGVTQDDHFADTWRFDFGELKQAHGWSLVVPVQTATTDPPLGMPPGRWSYQMAACGSGALMATGSTGYRVCTDDTWVWDPAPVKSAWCETAHRFLHACRRFSVDEHRSSFAKAGSGQPVQGASPQKRRFCAGARRTIRTAPGQCSSLRPIQAISAVLPWQQSPTLRILRLRSPPVAVRKRPRLDCVYSLHRVLLLPLTEDAASMFQNPE